MDSSEFGLIRFDGWELDPSRNELRRANRTILVEPQVLDLLVFLARHSGQVLTRDDLIKGVWHGRIVSDSAIASRISAARQAVGDDGRAQAIIRTVSRRGYRFVPEIVIAAPTDARPDLPDDAGSSPQIARRQWSKPSIVVLPFINLSGDPAQAYFSDGIADDIITDLSRYDELVVIARQSAFAFHDRKESVDDFARELGVDYLLEGGVRRAGGRARVTVQLIESATRTTLWADRFDREIGDILDVQEEIATIIVNTLVGQVVKRHYSRVTDRGRDNISAYEHALKAQQLIWSFSPQSTARARTEAEAAVLHDTGFARAHAILGWAHHIEGSNGWSADTQRAFDSALLHANAAVAADENEPWGHCVLGFTLQWLDRNDGRGLDEARQAVRLNPSNAHFRMIVGALLAYACKPTEALLEIDAAMHLNPLYPGLYLIHRSRALFVDNRCAEALVDIERASSAMPAHANALALLAACCEELHQHRRACEVVKELVRISPGFTSDYVRRVVPFADRRVLDRFSELLARAGLPD